ncbi:hypothetical protein GCM10009742_04760 [Kribbella karoonensis]|uniref:Uncharacterized protein n=1 Tax=Kribbella karoonensis TaxID=324851 RepID=A0ABN2CXM1_9ACTN
MVPRRAFTENGLKFGCKVGCEYAATVSGGVFAAAPPAAPPEQAVTEDSKARPATTAVSFTLERTGSPFDPRPDRPG